MSVPRQLKYICTHSFLFILFSCSLGVFSKNSKVNILHCQQVIWCCTNAKDKSGIISKTGEFWVTILNSVHLQCTPWVPIMNLWIRLERKYAYKTEIRLTFSFGNLAVRSWYVNGCRISISKYLNYFILRVRSPNLVHLMQFPSPLSKMFAFQNAWLTLFGTNALIFWSLISALYVIYLHHIR